MAEAGCLRDASVQNLEVSGRADMSNGTLAYKLPVINVSTATYTLNANQSGSIVYITDLDAAVTLPTAEAGLNYTFVCGGIMAGAKINAATGDCFWGNLKVTSTTDDKTSSDEVVATGGAVADSNVATLTGTSDKSGGQPGDTINCVAVDATHWLLSGVLTTSHAAPAALEILG